MLCGMNITLKLEYRILILSNTYFKKKVKNIKYLNKNYNFLEIIFKQLKDYFLKCYVTQNYVCFIGRNIIKVIFFTIYIHFYTFILI